jgi:UDP-N-acetylglucosamine--N-acetylmuramyl-(pentapeptide) pyrophosphoryl-undecaprenol N-acetylglucosamine transferase
MTASIKALIMAGGTGGHVFPALAVARALRGRGHSVVWMGAPDSFESRTVPPHGFPIEYIRVRGLRGKGLGRWLLAPWVLLRGVADAWHALGRQSPQVVLGMGGFAAGPGAIAARLRGLPLVIHEQNAVAGLTNRILAHMARVVLQAFPATLAGARTVGNPVREGFAQLPSPEQRLAGHGRPARLLIIGGSQGARALNLQVPAALAQIPADQRPEVWHQGGRTVDVAQAAYKQHGVSARIESFILDMVAAYDWADLVVCRAGASTIAELAAAGAPALLVPFPAAVDDHQTRNGRHLVDVGAARLIPEAELTPERLAGCLGELLGNLGERVRMGQAARAAAWPNAVDSIVETCLEVAAC